MNQITYNINTNQTNTLQIVNQTININRGQFSFILIFIKINQQQKINNSKQKYFRKQETITQPFQPHHLLNQILMSQLLSNVKPPNKQEEIFLTCFYCHQSEEQTQSDILIDTKCAMFHVCYSCFLQNKNEFTTICPCKQRLKDHVKIKYSRKQTILDQGVKLYQKQLKARSTWEDLDPDFVDLLAYFSRNGRGNQYAQKERELKTILKQLKKKENLIFDDLKKMKVPQLINRQNNDPTGKQACGYVSNYEKGLKFLFQSFGI